MHLCQKIVVLILQSFSFQTGEGTETHIHNRLRLYIGEAETAD